MKFAAFVGYAQHVSDADLTRGFGGLAVRLNPAEFAGSRGQGSSLEESGGPEPFVDSHGGHDSIFACECIPRRAVAVQQAVAPRDILPRVSDGEHSIRSKR